MIPPTSSTTILIMISRGVEPLTGEDIAEVVVFAAGRRENVVIADTLVFPNHQVCLATVQLISRHFNLPLNRLAQALCTASHRFGMYDSLRHWRYIDRVGRKWFHKLRIEHRILEYWSTGACITYAALDFNHVKQSRSINGRALLVSNNASSV